MNPDEALSSEFVGFGNAGDEAIEALWEHAKTLDAAEEREPVLEELAKAAANRKQFDRAAGAANYLTDPVRQARVWLSIAAGQRGIAYDGR